MFFNKLFSKNLPKDTIRKILAKDEVKQTVNNFIEHDLPEAEGVILIWLTHDTIYIDQGGLSEVEVLGSLEMMSHVILHEGVKKQ